MRHVAPVQVKSFSLLGLRCGATWRYSPDMRDAIKEGCTYVAPYPFTRERVTLPPDEDDGGSCTIETWRPGCMVDTNERNNTEWAADDVGTMLLSVVSIHRPGKYPTRVFYTRQWRDPDGKVFGKPGLRMTTMQAFLRLCRGYRFDFWLDGKETNLQSNEGTS